MTMAAHVSPSVDVFADARRDLESLFERLTKAGACSHVVLGELITEGLARVATRTFQGHLDALFAEERAEVESWVRPEGAEVRAIASNSVTGAHQERGAETLGPIPRAVDGS